MRWIEEAGCDSVIPREKIHSGPSASTDPDLGPKVGKVSETDRWNSQASTAPMADDRASAFAAVGTPDELRQQFGRVLPVAVSETRATRPFFCRRTPAVA